MIYTPSDLADRWGIQASTVKTMLRDGRLTGFKAGKEWRVTEEALRLYENPPEIPAVPGKPIII